MRVRLVDEWIDHGQSSPIEFLSLPITFAADREFFINGPNERRQMCRLVKSQVSSSYMMTDNIRIGTLPKVSGP